MTARRNQGPIYWACRPLAAPGNARRVRNLMTRLPDAALLESIAGGPVSGRWSIYAVDPARCERFGPGDDPLTVMAGVMRPWRRLEPTCPFPFVGGWIGYLAYEAGRWVEPAAGGRHALTDFGLACWRFYDTVLLHDVQNDGWYAAGIDAPQEQVGHRPSLTDRLASVTDIFDEASRIEAALPASPVGAQAAHRPSDDAGQWNLSPTEYIQRVQRLQAYLRAGDIYQANLTRRWHGPRTVPTDVLYDRLCRHNPADYAALLRFDDGNPRAILSSSPELFLHLEDQVVTTRPIKGTCPRTGESTADSRAVAALMSSDKERAELNMIIDLERNDLGRVCRYGSVEVVSAGDLEAHPTVYHRTATVRAELRVGQDAIDLLRATFPGGSITGAPKVRAMQIIDELEPEARGPYCGALGYIGCDGRMQLNLPIRTLMVTGDRLELAVGSGIVIGSDPQAEYDELNAKAAGMMRAIAEATSVEEVHA